MNKKIPFLFTISLLGLTVSALAASEEKIIRQVDAQPGGKLIIDVDFGKIDISPGVDNKVIIDASRKVDFGDDAKEKEYFTAVPITISAEGNVVTVRARASKGHRHWGHSTMNGSYTIQVPKSFAAKLDTGGGSITARDLVGDLRANSGGGKLKFAHLNGARRANTGGGSIELASCEGASEVESGGGDILSRDGQGTLRVRTGGGAIEVRNFSGDTDVETGGGELSLEKISGRIMGETGGGAITATVSGNDAHDISLQSSGGSIDLKLPATAAVDIDADTGSGKITTDLPLEFTDKEHEHLRGKLNGGGKRVVLRTSAGSISIKSNSHETVTR